MKCFLFNIHDSINVKANGETKEEAREKVIEKLSIGHYEFNEQSTALVSNGEELSD